METMIKILRTDRNAPLGKLADAEVHFVGGDLDGLKFSALASGADGTARASMSQLPSRPSSSQRPSVSAARGIDDPSAGPPAHYRYGYLDAPPRRLERARRRRPSADERPDAATTSNGCESHAGCRPRGIRDRSTACESRTTDTWRSTCR